MWFLNTAADNGSSLGGGEHHRLTENPYRLFHGGQFEHESFRELAAYGCFPFVGLLDQD
jgi:hypothetical protein